ncbi:uncharacterized protein LOC131255749 [Magnolia sinica]|uniref:uncharacterized protein LOC131255749 n=1 Tax=Magnolia sinica TaxID=86752 RepID=UPI002659CB20|nr:uncharacterized protein LOC131255749 [Magnolia sinica]
MSMMSSLLCMLTFIFFMKRYPRSLIKFCRMLLVLDWVSSPRERTYRWSQRLEDLEQLTNLQDELLDAASLLVKPGGTLVYSTCSIDPEENEERVSAFLLKHP